ncbi:hypothetical protein [Streptomyces sp. NPDC054987]
MRVLLVAARVEAASLALLLGNLLTVHAEAVASLGGPVHGTAYLVVILTAWRATAEPGVRWRACVPGLGGLLALRQLRRAAAAPAPPEGPVGPEGAWARKPSP